MKKRKKKIIKIKTIELMVGKEKLEEYYSSDSKDIIKYIENELCDYSQEKIEQFFKSISEEASIVYYEKEEVIKLFEEAKKKEIKFYKILNDYIENGEEFINLYRRECKR